MIRDRVQETTTTTGSGNLTLAGAATNYITFNTAFGTNQRFIYWIVDDTNNVWETGVGYLSASTTLVREKVYDNSSDTTSALTLSAGTKSVFCAPNASSEFASTYQCHDDATRQWVFGLGNQESGTISLGQYQCGYFPFYLTVGGLYSGIGLEVTTAQASSNGNTGIYSINRGRPDKKLAETGSFATTTTGFKTNSFSGGNILLNAGWYYLACIGDSNPNATMRSSASDSIGGNSPAGQELTDISDRTSHLRENVGSFSLPTTAASTFTEDELQVMCLGLINVA